MITRDDLEWWLKLAPELDWTFAKSMKDHPHSYVVRGKTLDEEDFLRAVKVIRTFGEPGKFYQAVNIYLVSERIGFRWWTMGDTLDGTIIINQAPWDQTFGRQNAPQTRSGLEMFYDQLATEYDERFLTPECLAENQAVARVIAEHSMAYAPRMLDIGCGTGLVLDLKLTHPSLYTGVDPSQAMLNELVRKHKRVTSLLPGRWEDMAARAGQGYDVIVSLFGSASYIEPRFIPQIPKLATLQGLTVLMHYKQGYVPDYDRSVPDTAAASREAAAAIPGAHVFELNNFQVTTVKRD
jgi:SAM-dependent methyltransferase